jgi:hypothetical protein
VSPLAGVSFSHDPGSTARPATSGPISSDPLRRLIPARLQRAPGISKEVGIWLPIERQHVLVCFIVDINHLLGQNVLLNFIPGREWRSMCSSSSIWSARQLLPNGSAISPFTVWSVAL